VTVLRSFVRSLPFDYIALHDAEQQPCYCAGGGGGAQDPFLDETAAVQLASVRARVYSTEQPETIVVSSPASCTLWSVTVFPVVREEEEEEKKDDDGRVILGVGTLAAKVLREDKNEGKKVKQQAKDTLTMNTIPVDDVNDSFGTSSMTADASSDCEEEQVVQSPDANHNQTNTDGANTKNNIVAQDDPLRDMLDASAVRKVVIDARTGVILDCNRAFAETFASSSETTLSAAWKGQNLWTLLLPNGKKAPLGLPTSLGSTRQRQTVDYVLETGRESSYEVRFEQDGTWWEDRAVPIFDTGTKSIRAIVLEERNVDCRKTVEIELEEHQNHHLGLFRHMPTGYAFCQVVRDPVTGKVINYIFLEVNKHFEEIMKVPAERCVGKLVTEAFPGMENDKNGNIPMADRIVREGHVDRFSNYYKVLDMWVAGISYKHSDDKFITLFLDTSEQVAMKEKLRESEERHRTLFENMRQGVTYVDEKGTQFDCNPSAERLLGLSREQIVGVDYIDPDWRMIHEDGTDFPLDQLPVRIALRTGKPVNNVIMGVYNPREKKHRWLSVDASPRFRLGEKIPYQVYTIFTDVTESKNSKKALMEAKEKAESADQLKSAFLATMSHEIRTPLNGIMGHLDLITSNGLCEEHRDENLEGLQVAYQSGELLISIIEDILDLSKIEAGQLDIHPRPFSFKTIMEQTANLARAYQIQKQKQHVAFHVNVDENISEFICGDDCRIRQVLNNLISNAIKFTDNGSVVLAVEIDSESSELKILVKDSGKGIPSDHLDVVFEPFRQVEFGDTRKHGGTGLGLTICKRLVELMGGQMTVESSTVEGDHGSRFVFSLPYKPVDMERNSRTSATHDRALAVPRNASTAAGVLPEKKSGKILLAEDDPVSRRIASRMLQKAGYDILVAEDGMEAVSMFEKHQSEIILVLCDVMMPRMDGLEATRQIRALLSASSASSDLPIIALSAGAMKGDREKGLEIGMTDYLTKPVNYRDLVQTLQRYVGHEGAYDLSIK